MRENCCSKELETKTTWLLYFICLTVLLIIRNRWLQKLKAQFRQTTIAFICIYCLFIFFPWVHGLYVSYPIRVLLFALKCAFEFATDSQNLNAAKVLSKQRMSKLKTRERERKRKKITNKFWFGVCLYWKQMAAGIGIDCRYQWKMKTILDVWCSVYEQFEQKQWQNF